MSMMASLVLGDLSRLCWCVMLSVPTCLCRNAPSTKPVACVHIRSKTNYYVNDMLHMECLHRNSCTALLAA
jgi:hypothetical protein